MKVMMGLLGSRFIKRKFMRIFYLICFCLNSLIGLNQNVSVSPQGLVADQSAILDVNFNNKGFGFPKVSLISKTDLTTIPFPATSLIVYNYSVSGTNPNDVFPGFYYFNGIKWQRLGDDNNWKLLGNTLPVNNSNFIGSINDKSLVFKFNNVLSGNLTKTNTSLGYMSLLNVDSTSAVSNLSIGAESQKLNVSGDNNVSLGYNSLSNHVSGNDNVAVGSESLYNNLVSGNVGLGRHSLYQNTLGEKNTAAGLNSMEKNTLGSRNNAIGTNSLFNNTLGSDNIAVGVESLFLNTAGNYNIAIGNYALRSNIMGNYNVAIGFESLRNCVGFGNVAVGHQSLKNLTLGSNNTVIGYKAGQLTSTGNNQILIGYQVEALQPNSNNQLNIGNFIFGVDGRISIGLAVVPSVTCEIHGSNSLRIPVGTTAQRPIIPEVGMVRYNSSIGKIEGYDGTTWQPFY
jgi:hypothetical protein